MSSLTPSDSLIDRDGLFTGRFVSQTCPNDPRSIVWSTADDVAAAVRNTRDTYAENAVAFVLRVLDCL